MQKDQRQKSLGHEKTVCLTKARPIARKMSKRKEKPSKERMTKVKSKSQAKVVKNQKLQQISG